MPVTERFDGGALDLERWVPAYLPCWASRAENAARYRLSEAGLVLEIAPEQGLWCAATHRPPAHPPLRTSTIASGDWSGPLGSTRGPQPFRDDLRVQEEQPRTRGWLVGGVGARHLQIRCRMSLSPRSMAALWLAGWDEDPADSGELCVVEVFGSAVEPGRSAEIGVGIKALRDARLREDFAAPRLPIDIADWHTYRVDWDAAQAVFSVDGEVVRRCASPPTYPMVIMVGVFDFPPSEPSAADGDHVPSIEIAEISGTATLL